MFSLAKRLEPANTDLPLDLLEFLVASDEIGFAVLGECCGKTIRVGHSVACLERSRQPRERPIRVDQFDAEACEIGYRAVGLRLGYLPGEDVPDLSRVDDRHVHRNAVLMRVRDQVGDLLRGSFVAEIRQRGPRIEHQCLGLARHQSSLSRFFSAASAVSRRLPLYFPRRFWM